MTENRKTIEALLAIEDQKEAADVLNFTKSLTEEQKNNFETLLHGVRIGIDLARTAKTT